MAATKRELPSREASQFKGLLRFFEHRQYKRGLKSADQILKKFPEHGETLAMKGLFLSSLERKEEGFEFVRKGLKNDLTSHICWHVFGLLYRAEKNYEEAIKCYRNALKFDKNNMQILRDLALLQIQMRNYEAYADTRDLLLSLNTNNRMFWIGYAISLHLLGDYDLAANVLRAFENSMKIPPPSKDYDHSELLMYRNLTIEEKGDLEDALKDLDTIQNRVCDVIGVWEKRANLLQKLNRLDEAKEVYRRLINENPDYRFYLDRYLTCSGIDTSDKSQENQIVEAYDQLATQYPRSNLLKRLPLNYMHGDTFQQRIDTYFKAMLRKGVPSLFANIKSLYADTKRVEIIEKLMLDYQKQLCDGKTLDESVDKEAPTTYLWTLFYLAQHFDKLNQQERALKYINEAIAHTPTLVELYMVKARIAKHLGQPELAAQIMVEARQLDLQDRFVNSKCTKYLLRNNQVEEAEKTIGLFTRPDVKEPVKDLIDMQCLWFEMESSRSLVRQNQLGKALKLLHQIGKHFDDFIDDQFDFHTYCLRKTTIQSYLRLLKFEDTIYTSPVYVETADLAIKAYLKLYDEPQMATGGAAVNNTEGGASANASAVDTSTMTPSELKKYMSKLRKQEAKIKEQQQQQKAKESRSDTTKKAASTTTEEDKDGKSYLETKDPLAAATQWLQILQTHLPNHVNTHILGFEVAIRKQKPLLALATMTIESSHPNYLGYIVKLEQALANESIVLPKEAKSILKAALDGFLGGKSLVQFTRDQFEEHATQPSFVAMNGLACQYAKVSNTNELIGEAIKKHSKSWSLKVIHNMRTYK
ncbi:NMDA receptor-regulated protein 1-domain-containing protein [Syncephalis plumigaleata]|nr:NMDA receptor-regulated protein 1-domain-containing protein [Syncephalis plumigaleata]